MREVGTKHMGSAETESHPRRITRIRFSLLKDAKDSHSYAAFACKCLILISLRTSR